MMQPAFRRTWTHSKLGNQNGLYVSMLLSARSCKLPTSVTFPATYTIHGQVLETVDSAKYLGVFLGPKLNFNNHVDSPSPGKQTEPGPFLSKPEPHHLEIQGSCLHHIHSSYRRISSFFMGPLYAAKNKNGRTTSPT